MLAIATLLPTPFARALTANSTQQKPVTAAGDSSKTTAPTPDLFTGTFRYSIPIDVPRGPRDIQPGLALTYRSGGPNGWLGVGWEFELGAVERSTDGGVRYDLDDYVLKNADGTSDLVETSTGQFRSKTEATFVRVRKLTASDGQPYFEAHDRNGVRYVYGSTSTSRQVNPFNNVDVFRWAIDRIEDTHGNFIQFDYRRFWSFDGPSAYTSLLYPRTIQYGGISGQTGEVTFYGESREDRPTSYATGYAAAMIYRLRTIEVRAAGSRVRAYRLDYSTGPTTARSRLASIQQFGADAVIGTDGAVTGGSSLPKHSFDYGSGATSTNYSSPGPVLHISGSLQEAEHDIGRVMLGDFDGDGRTDIASIAGWGGPVAMRIFYSTAHGFEEAPGPVIDVPGDHEGLITKEHRFKLGDFNGDGRTDIAVLEGWDDTLSQAPPMSVYFANATGRGFHRANGPTRYSAGDHEGARIDAGRVMVGDFNGDGRSDFITVEGWDSARNGAFRMWVYYSTGEGFAQPSAVGPPLWVAGDYAGMWDVLARVKLGDFNGDGKTDVAYLEGWGTSAPTPMSVYLANAEGTGFLDRRNGPARWVGGDHDAVRIDAGRLLVGDFNGDGASDIIAADGWNGGPTPMNLYLGGNDDPRYPFTSAQPVGPPLYYPGDYAGMYDVIRRFKLGDFNGDGKTDIAIVEGWSGYNAMSLYLSTGYGFLPRRPGPIRLMGGSHDMVRLDSDRVGVGDLDGDGADDFSAIDGWQGAAIWPSGREVPAGDFLMKIYPAQSPTTDLLRFVSNGIGGSSTIEYSSSTIYANTQLPIPLRVVSKISTTVKGTAATANTYLFYAGGYLHLGEREFRGFSYASIAEPSGANGERLLRETWFHQGSGTLSALDQRLIAASADDPSVASGHMKGLPWKHRVSEPPAAPNAPTRAVETLTTYWADAPGSGWVDADGHAPWFTPEHRTETTTWEADLVVQTIATEYQEYDDFGNVRREIQHGDLSAPADDLVIVRTFNPATDPWIVSLPATEDVYSGGMRMAGKEYFYDGIAPVAATASDAERGAACLQASSNTRPTRGDLTRVVSWHCYDINWRSTGACAEGPHPETRTGYDDAGNVVCTRTPRGAVTTVRYDASGTFPVSFTNSLGHTVNTRYYGVDSVGQDFGMYGQIESVTDPNGAQTRFFYDSLGRIVRQVAPGATRADGGVDLAVTTWSRLVYDIDGRQFVRSELHSKAAPVDAMTVLGASSLATWTESYLDGLGRVVRERRPGAAGNVTVTTREFDARGAVSSESIPEFEASIATARRVAFAYDSFGRIVKRVTPNGTAYTCYAGSSAVSVDEKNQRRRETRDAHGRITAVEEYEGTYATCTTSRLTPYATTTYAYDALGQLTLVADAKGNLTDVRYDSLGRKRYIHDPDAGEIHYRYDLDGNLVWMQDPVLLAYSPKPAIATDDKALTFEYDPLGRLLLRRDPTGSSVVMTYDASSSTYGIGRRTSMSDDAGTATYQYDPAGRVATMARTFDATHSYSFSWAYDVLGRVKTLSYPTGDDISYGYDSAGNLLNAGSYVAFSDFNAIGQPATATYGNGVKATHTYYDATDSRLKTTAITSPPDAYGPGTGVRTLSSLSYGYDALGNVTRVDDLVDYARSQSFTYDDLNRLTGAQSNAYGLLSFAYDHIGNLTFKEGVSYYYPTTPHSLAGTTGDRPHAITSTSSRQTFAYDGNGNTTSGSGRTIAYDFENRPVSVKLKSGETSLFSYDGDGHRAKKIVGAATTLYVDRFLECTSAACGIYVFAGSTRVALKTGADVKYYHQNHLGSTVLVTGASGTSLEEIHYRPYGASALDSGAIDMDHKFTGQPFDSETGLYYYGGRYYDPALGRFISPDPIVPGVFSPQALNRYSYCFNNPTTLVDPTGHIPVAELVFLLVVGPPAAPAVGTTASVAAVTWAATYSVSSDAERKKMVRDIKALPSEARKASDKAEHEWENAERYWGEKSDRAGDWIREKWNGAHLANGGVRPGRGLTDSHGRGFLNSFDYVSVGVGFYDGVGGGVHFTLDRQGQITWGWGAGVGLGGRGSGVSLGTFEGDAGTPVHGTRPSPEQLRALTTGWSTTLSAAFGPGIGVNWPWHSEYTATELQLQVPGFGLSAGKSYYITTVDMLSW